jgi:hypothetical protein
MGGYKNKTKQESTGTTLCCLQECTVSQINISSVEKLNVLNRIVINTGIRFMSYSQHPKAPSMTVVQAAAQ